MTDQTTNTKFNRPAHLVETKSLRDLLGDLRKAETWLLLAALAAFLASAFFVVKYFVGGDMNPAAWTGEQWANATLGLGITAVITAAQAFLYASGYKGPAAIVATVIVVFFGLFSEVSQSMEREDATVRHRSESSAVFQAALGSIQNLSTQAAAPVNNGMLSSAAGKVAQHEAELAACKSKYSSAARIKRCEKYELSKIAEARGEQAAAQVNANDRAASVGSALTAAISQAKTLEYDEDKHYAMIRLIKGMFGVAGIWASFMFSIIIIGTFEYAFHFVGAYVSDHKQALRLLGRDTLGELIHPDKEQDKAGNIPKDYGNKNRDEYLKWVTPERSSHPPPNTRTVQTEASPAPANIPADAADERPEPLPSKVRDMTRERFFRLIYTEVRTRIINGSIKPTVRPVTDAVTDVIKHHTRTLGLQPSLIGKPERQKIAEKILEKLATEAVLELNQVQGVGKPKYRLASRWSKAASTGVPTGGHLA